ncbi:MAG: hypothetical protein K6347_08585, partial [Campylobacterales bacterium]
RRSHKAKTRAADYVADLQDDLLETLAELRETEEEIEEIIERLRDGEGTLEALLEKIGERFLNYAHAIGLLLEFEDLAYAIKTFALFVQQCAHEELTPEQVRKLIIFTDSIRLDLISWRTTIFVEKSANDIHYLDSSLFSSCLQAQLLLDSEAADEGGELDLF